MAKTTRYLDAQGRIILPAHIRKVLNLTAGKVVDVELDDSGTIRITTSQERCALCGEGLEETEHTTIRVGTGTKHICKNCVALIKEGK